MRIETICTGDELLTGLTSDTNSRFFQEALLERTGMTVRRGVVVGDDRADIIEAIDQAVSRCEVVLVSGGLGPTSDDLTAECAATAAGVPLVEALDSVGGAAGNSVYEIATKKIQQEVSTGTALTVAMTNTNLFPSMVLQMCSIGEESGSIDHMLGKAADFYEAEVDDMVAGISSLMEPIIIVILGTVIGGIVVAMYLPIFKLGQVV